MGATEGPIRTTHAGSLPRPAELDDLWARHSRQLDVDPGALALAVDAATADVVARQAAVGIDIANNGEQGRESFFTYVRDRLSGFGGIGDPRPFKDIFAFPSYVELKQHRLVTEHTVSLGRLPAAIDAVRSLGTEAVEAEVAQLQRLADGYDFAGLFLTAASPGIVASAMTNRYYGSLGEYVDAVADALAAEYAAIVRAGLTLQIDAPDLAMERASLFADKPVDDFLDFATAVVAAVNRATRGLPAEQVRLHVCWGNYDGPHLLDIALTEILPVISRAEVGTIVLSLANPRHAHEYRLLAELPAHWRVVAGVIDTTTNYVEHPEVVADRLERAATVLGGIERLGAGTDCGFATAAGRIDVAPEVAWEKLRALVDGTQLANARLQ